MKYRDFKETHEVTATITFDEDDIQFIRKMYHVKNVGPAYRIFFEGLIQLVGHGSECNC